MPASAGTPIDRRIEMPNGKRQWFVPDAFLPADSSHGTVNHEAACVLNANHVRGTQGGVTVDVKLPELPEPKGFTVLGNITTHSIAINGTALNNPWAPLNAQMP